MKPFFSILIPTKNRLEYLKHAINSVLNQTFNDFEIVISDNNSKDGTKKLVESYKDKRIKYFNTGKDLQITDNWNNAFNHSEGKYIIQIGDDDYLLPTCLEELKKTINQHENPDIVYTQSAIYDYEENKLSFQKSVSNETREESWEAHIGTFFNTFSTLIGAVCCFSKSVANKIKKDGKLFVGPAPDFYAFTSMTMYANKIVKIDKFGGIGGSMQKSMSHLQFNYSTIDKVSNEDKLLDEIKTPLSGTTLPNVKYQAIVLIKNQCPEKTKKYKINMGQYYNMNGDMFAKFIVEHIKNIGDKKSKTTMKEFKIFLKKASKKAVVKCLFFWIPRSVIFNIVSRKVKDKITNAYYRLTGGITMEHVYLDEKSNIEDAANAMLKLLG